MIRFIYSLFLFSALLVGGHVLYYEYYCEYDWAYKRLLSSGCEKSLILGTSRAAQGIQPDIIRHELDGNDYSLPIYNFSFTIASSPYGETYYNAICKKLTKEKYDNGLFILAVDPWSLSCTGSDKENYRETSGCLSYVDIYMRPNLQYIYRNYKLLSKNSSMRLHDDGWLEVDVPMDSTSVSNRLKAKKEDYKDSYLKKSDYRISWLLKTIDILKQRGEVYLVRIPANVYFIQLENKFWPGFEYDMAVIANRENVAYISFADRYADYHTTDGNHLYKDDGARFTKVLCDSIKIRKQE